MGPIDNIPPLDQRMAWRQTGAKPLSEPMMALAIDAYVSLNLDELICPTVRINV